MKFKKETLVELKSRFDRILNIEENSSIEFWYARDLQKQLGYAEWRNFLEVIEKAMKSCENTRMAEVNHFVKVNKMVEIVKSEIHLQMLD